MEVTTISAHPHLITTAGGLALAKERYAGQDWAKKTVARLADNASSLATDPLPVFQKDWWAAARKKHWTQTYPEINEHTMFAVRGPVDKARAAAIAYAATGDAAHAELARKVLLHYTRYEFFAEHPDVGLNWSAWGTRALEAYDLIHDTLTDSERAAADYFFQHALEGVMKNDQWWIRDNMGGLFNNHFAWHKLFIGSIGLLTGEDGLVDYALNSDQGIRELIENASRDDGLWFESSINYHFTAVDAFAIFAGHLANSGHPFDLWNHRFANGRCLRDLLLGPIQTMFPDETLPTIGDTYGRRARLAGLRIYYNAYSVYRLPEMAWLLRNDTDVPGEALFVPELPAEPAAPAMRARLWPEHGYVALRSREGVDYWSGEGFSVFLSFDHDGIHSHRDKFGLMAFGRGKHVATDVEALSTAKHAFSSRVQGELNRSTVCHNTVMVDGKDHNPIGHKLELVSFIDGPEVKLATIADTHGVVAQGVTMTRTVAVTEDFVLDIFQLASDAEHTYDYLFHTPADHGAFEPDDGSEGVKMGSKPPWMYLVNARRKVCDDDWCVSARQGGVTARLMMVGKPGTKVITCQFPGKDDLREAPSPMLIARRKAKSTVFVALLQVEPGALPVTRVSAHDGRHGCLRVAVDIGGKVRDFSSPSP